MLDGNTDFLASLNECIDAIGGNSNKKITADKNGHDQYFKTTPTEFGRGSVLFKICVVLNAEIGEIVEFVQEQPCAVESIVTNESVDNE